MDLVSPVTVKLVTMQCARAHLGRGDCDAGARPARVPLRAHAQPRRGAGVADQVDDRFEGPARASPPIRGDVTEDAMLDLVPLAGARGGSDTR